MSKESYHAELVHRLARIDTAIEEAEAALAIGSDHDKVQAAGELTVLRRERDGIAERLSWLEVLPAGAWPEFRATLREEIDALLSVFQPHGHIPVAPRFAYLAALHRRPPR